MPDPIVMFELPLSVATALTKVIENNLLRTLEEGIEHEKECQRVSVKVDDHTYTYSDYIRFVTDMEAADIDVRHYGGRNFYSGPAAQADTFDEVCEIIRATTIRLQIDQLGRGWIVYPKH